MTQQDDIIQAVLTDDDILLTMRAHLNYGDGGYVCDTAPETVIAAGRALLSKLRAPVAAPSDETLRLAGVIADKIEDGTLFQGGIFSRRELADKVRTLVQFVRGASAPVAGEATQKAKNDTCHAETEHERVTALAYWLDQQTFEPGMLSIAAATLRAMLSRDAAPQASAEDDREALAHKVNLLTAESQGHRSAAGHLSALVDELRRHLIDARQAMADFQQAFAPAFDTPETLTMVPNEALVPFCAVLDRLRGLDLPQADKDGGQQRDGDVDVTRLLAAAKGMTKLYGNVWDRTDGALVVFPENVARFDAAFDALRAAVGEVVDDATQPEQGERDE